MLTDYFSFRIIVEVLRREFGKNTEVALENVFGVLLPSEKGSLKASPVLPSQHKCSPRAPGMCRHVPGMCFLEALHPPPSACPSCRDQPPSLLWPSLCCGEAQPGVGLRGTHRRTSTKGQRPSFHPFFGGAQLPPAAAAVRSDYGPDIRGKNPQRETISDCTKGSCGPVFQLHHRKFARGN